MTLDYSDLFYQFIREHNCEIYKELRDSYHKLYDQEHKNAIRRGQFGAFVGLPLIVVWLIWGYNMKTTQEQIFPAVVLFTLGLCVRFYSNRVITDALKQAFYRREYNGVLISYVEKCRESELNNAKQSELIEINEKYDYFASRIYMESFFHYNGLRLNKNGKLTKRFL